MSQTPNLHIATSTQPSSHTSCTDTDPSSAPIGIFDSGVGGISILKEIQKQLPNEKLIYIADSANAPYGDKSADFIKKRSLQLSEFLLTHHIKVLVVACNTATTEAISFLRKHLTIPIVGVEPAIKPAAEQSKNNIIGILATHRTIQSKRLQELIDLYASHTTIIPQACPGLVEVVENQDAFKEKTINQLLQRYTQTMRNQKADTIVLGCTHYPFLLEQIQNIIGKHISILDTGKPVAAQLERILNENSLENTVTHTSPGATIIFYSSLDDPLHFQTIKELWNPPASLSVQLLPPV